MIIGFLGKGGSGKSTLATSVANFLHSQGKLVLAIDADYNMDLSHNLSAPEHMTYLGETARVDSKSFFERSESTPYKDIVLDEQNEKRFSLYPIDSFTAKYSVELKPNLRLMAIGPQTMSVLTDNMCSHGLGGSLKLYLPLIEIQENQAVVVDEKAGVDSVGTGIPTGFNLAVIVVEPTVYGVKAGKQIATILDHYAVPYTFVINKIKSDTNIGEIESQINGDIVAKIPFSETVPDESILPIITYAENIVRQKGDMRFKQSKAKFIFNKEYNG